MKKFDWDTFGREENKIAVWCKTEEEAIDFCKKSHEKGYDWGSGISRVAESFWEFYQSETCYATEFYSPRDFYIKNNYNIFEWSDFIHPYTFTKSDLRDGDFILRRNGDVEMALPSMNSLVCRRDGWNDMESITENLTENFYYKTDIDWDIVEVRRPIKKSDCQFGIFEFEIGEVVYNRERDEQPIEMTLDEVCEALGKKIKIVEG